jgi:hypothetical protein
VGTLTYPAKAMALDHTLETLTLRSPDDRDKLAFHKDISYSQLISGLEGLVEVLKLDQFALGSDTGTLKMTLHCLGCVLL